VSARAFRGRCTSTRDQDALTSCGRWCGRNVDSPPVDVDRVAAERPQEQLQALIGDLAAASGIDTHVLVFLRPMADSERVVNSPLVLDEAHGMVQRQHGGSHENVEHTRSGSDRRSEDQW
jgi:hypothetical protein